MRDFRKIQFGYMDALTEGQEHPELLINGYIDNDKVVEKALNKSTFLFLGYKGSGKSSLSEHLRLVANDDIVVSPEELKDFPFKNFSKIVPGDAEAEVKAREAWRWLLLIKVFSKLVEDNVAYSDSQEDVNKFIATFTQAGLFPVSGMSDLVKKTSSKQFQVSLKAFSFEYTQTKESGDVSISLASDLCKKLITSFKESHRHLIIIDDLDDNITTRENQYQAIAALIKEVKTLNTFMLQENVPVKILVLCRTDIFDRLPDPNKNKIKRDNSFTFSWYREGIDTPSDSPLIQLINTRARLVYPEIKDVLTDFFPSSYKGKKIYGVLLDYTRHTPRDFIQLVNSIQAQCKGCKVQAQDIEKGIKDYSLEYFVTEIEDEMAGYINPNAITAILGVFSILRKREFSFSEFQQKYSDRSELREIDVNEVMRVLYDCSAIGQKYSYDGQTQRFAFKYRNRNSAFNPKDTIQLHKGLWKALNVNY